MRYFRTPFIQLENYETNTDVVKIISEKVARKNQIIVLDQMRDTLILGMVNPDNEKPINRLEKRLKTKVVPVRVDIQEWANTINNHYRGE